MADEQVPKPGRRPKVPKLDRAGLHNLGLAIIEKDLKRLLRQKERSPQEMAAISRYVKDLHAAIKVDEAYALQAQSEMAKLSKAELARALEEAHDILAGK